MKSTLVMSFRIIAINVMFTASNADFGSPLHWIGVIAAGGYLGFIIGLAMAHEREMEMDK